jgi:tetratricopeptide (TPR) repeat protein
MKFFSSSAFEQIIVAVIAAVIIGILILTRNLIIKIVKKIFLRAKHASLSPDERHYHLARDYYDISRTDEAKKYLSRLIASDTAGNNLKSKAYTLRSRIYSDESNEERALQDAEEAMNLPEASPKLDPQFSKQMI